MSTERLLSPQDKPLLHLGLMVAAAATTFGMGVLQWSDARTPLGAISQGAAYAGAVLTILLSHEMGHYLMARRHGVDCSLPYVIPMPLGFGTLGAVIRIRSPFPTRDALVDIGAAGPLAGLAVALPLLWVGLSLSHVGAAPEAKPPEMFFGPFSIWGLVRWAAFDGPSPLGASGVTYFGDNVLTLLMQRLRFGALPSGQEVFVHPVFLAAWFGLLMTCFNLFPIGQLDAGHLTHAWFGTRAVTVGRGFCLALLGLSIFCSLSWLVWFFVTWRVIGFRHPEVLQPEQPLSKSRKWVCTICFIFFVLTLIPVPLGAS